jgi:hypothetical protein
MGSIFNFCRVTIKHSRIRDKQVVIYIHKTVRTFTDFNLVGAPQDPPHKIANATKVNPILVFICVIYLRLCYALSIYNTSFTISISASISASDTDNGDINIYISTVARQQSFHLQHNEYPREL